MPDHPVIADTLGWACFRRNQIAEAERLLRSAVQRLPRDPAVNYHVAAVLHARGLDDEARQFLETSLQSPSAFSQAKEAMNLKKTLAAGVKPAAPR